MDEWTKFGSGAGVLMTALKNNDTADVGAIEGAMTYEACDTDHCETEDQRLECVIDKAFVNLGGGLEGGRGGGEGIRRCPWVPTYMGAHADSRPGTCSLTPHFDPPPQ